MTIGDKCPYCGRELLSGYLQSARQIIWSQEEKSISFRADEDGDLVVSHGIWEGSFADCRYCADCGIFLLERPAQPPKFGERLRGKVRPPARRRHNGMRKDRTRRHAACGLVVCRVRSDVEAEERHVAVVHDIVLALRADEALLLSGGHAAAGFQVVERNDLGADEAALEVRVDLTSGLRRLRAACDRPGAALIAAARQE